MIFRIISIFIICLLFAPYAGAISIQSQVGGAVDLTRPPVSCTHDIQLEQTYTHSTTGVITRATSFAIDPGNQRGFIGLYMGGLDWRIDRININPLSSSPATTGLLTNLFNNAAPVVTVNRNGPFLVNTIHGLLTNGFITFQERNGSSISLSIVSEASINAPGASSLASIVGGTGSVAFGGTHVEPTTFPLFSSVGYNSGGATALGTLSGNTGSFYATAISRSDATFYTHHCTGIGGDCSPVVDRFSGGPLTFIGSLGAFSSVVSAGMDIDEASNAWYFMDVPQDRIRRFTLHTLTQTAEMLDSNMSQSGFGALKISYSLNKIYAAYTGLTGGLLSVVRLNPTTMIVEENETAGGPGELAGTAANVLWIDDIFLKLYVLVNANSATPQIRQYRLCS